MKLNYGERMRDIVYSVADKVVSHIPSRARWPLAYTASTIAGTGLGYFIGEPVGGKFQEVSTALGMGIGWFIPYHYKNHVK